MTSVHEIHWLSNHGPVNAPSSLQLITQINYHPVAIVTQMFIANNLHKDDILQFTAFGNEEPTERRY